MKKLRLIDLESFLTDQNWHNFAAFGSTNGSLRKLQIQIGGEMFRVLVGREIVYEGYDDIKAVAAYNGEI